MTLFFSSMLFLRMGSNWVDGIYEEKSVALYVQVQRFGWELRVAAGWLWLIYLLFNFCNKYPTLLDVGLVLNNMLKINFSYYIFEIIRKITLTDTCKL